MSIDNDDALEKLRDLRNDYLELEARFKEERKCLTRAINALGIILQDNKSIGDDVEALRKVVNEEEDLPVDAVDKAVATLKNQFLAGEVSAVEDQDRLAAVARDLTCVSEMLRDVMRALLDNFYPLGESLEARAKALKAAGEKEVSNREFKNLSVSFLDYVAELKSKIAADYRHINNTFRSLLEQIKDLERSLLSEFAGETTEAEIAKFETEINQEVAALVDSFDPRATLDEIRKAVVKKINNIRKAVAEWKKKELEKTKTAAENVRKLNERVLQVEKDARELSRKAEDLQMTALRDGLTGLYNRKAFDIKLENAVEEYHQRHEAFSLILFDVDNFKAINDSYGHMAGDRVLLRISQCLRAAFRREDFVARFGGDEFVAIVESFSEEQAKARVEAFRATLHQTRFFTRRRGDVAVKVSAGLALPCAEDTAESLLERADRAMYQDKHKGSDAPNRRGETAGEQGSTRSP